MAQNNSTATFIDNPKVKNSPFRYGTVHFNGKQVGTFHIDSKFHIGIFPHFFMNRDTEEEALRDINRWLQENEVTCDCYLGTAGFQI